MNIIDKILRLEEFKRTPPVFVDIGASGHLNKEWKKIAKYSICIAFDADDRDVEYVEKESSNYHRLVMFNKIVAEDSGKKKFFLTRSPYCSSVLRPNIDKLKDWSFCELFEVEREIEIESISLSSVLSKLSLDYVDWFKTDSQGMDLRLFRNLGEKIIPKVIVAEFEPGIMDSYVGEDKMHEIMEFMEKYPFWLDSLKVKGTQRISCKNYSAEFSKIQKKIINFSLKASAFWGEMSYINTFQEEATWNKRDLLLGWIFATIRQQHGFAYEISKIGQSRIGDPIFSTLERCSIGSIKSTIWRKLPFYIVKRIIGKITSLK